MLTLVLDDAFGFADANSYSLAGAGTIDSDNVASSGQTGALAVADSQSIGTVALAEGYSRSEVLIDTIEASGSLLQRLELNSSSGFGGATAEQDNDTFSSSFYSVYDYEDPFTDSQQDTLVGSIVITGGSNTTGTVGSALWGSGVNADAQVLVNGTRVAIVEADGGVSFPFTEATYNVTADYTNVDSQGNSSAGDTVVRVAPDFFYISITFATPISDGDEVDLNANMYEFAYTLAQEGSAGHTSSFGVAIDVDVVQGIEPLPNLDPDFIGGGTLPGGEFPGDLDGDGDVDNSDFLLWSSRQSLAPQVTEVTISGTDSVHAPYGFGENGAVGSGEQLRTVPVGGANTIEIAFNEPINPLSLQDALTLENLDPFALGGITDLTAVAPPSFSMPAPNIGRWEFDLSGTGLPEDFFTRLAGEIRLDDTVTDSWGNQLDGEWVNPTSVLDPFSPDVFSTFPSGDGTEGGGFTFRFGMMAGDQDRDNDVDGYNFLNWQLMNGTSPATFIQGDYDGNNTVNGADLAIWQSNFGYNLSWEDMVFADMVAPLSASAVQELNAPQASILVSTSADEDDGDYSLGDLSLREALSLADDLPGAVEIHFYAPLMGQTITLDPTLSQLDLESDVSIVGPGADQLVIDADGNSRVLEVDSGVTATLSGLTITGGVSSLHGGGVMNRGDLTLNGVRVEGNQASSHGGGVYVFSGATLSLQDTTIDGNSAVIGGGIGGTFAAGQSLIIDSSTISNNTTSGHVAGLSVKGTSGGAATEVLITNSTLSGNSSGGAAGAIRAITNTELTLINSTIYGNSAATTAGGVFSHNGANTALHNTIVAGNTAGNAATRDAYAIGSFDSTSQSNLIGVLHSTLGTLDSSNLTGTSSTPLDPGLLALAGNGGPTQTHQLQTSSPAYDGGSNIEAAGLVFDQRGYSRVIGSAVDIGAVELGAFSVANQAAQVVGVEVSGSNSIHSAYDFDAAVGSGEQLRTVPVGGADTVTITFSENVSVQQSDLQLTGLQTADIPSVASFAYDPHSRSATWTFSSPLIADQYLIELADSVVDLDSEALDGEWINPASLTTVNAGLSTFPSGDGTAGGAFEFVFTNLPDDFNRDNVVSGSDFLTLQLNFGSANTIFSDGDANGDGFVDGLDSSIFSSNYGADLIDLALAADFDNDYDIDGADYLEWQSHFGQTVTPDEDGDANGDGTVDNDDLDIWNDLFGIDLEVLG